MTDQQYWQVLDNVVRLEVLKGHQRWSISDLARGSGVGRTLIYYYFGKSKAEIVQAALKVIGDEFFGLSPERLKLLESGGVRASILKTRELLHRAPHIREFFFHWRHQKSEVRDHLLMLEKRYMQKLKKLRPELNPIQAQALFTVFFGLAVVPELQDDVLDEVLKSAFDKNR